jgi:trehalose-phosphatase
VLSDYDGTLTPIVDDPAGAWLTPGTRADLRALACSGRAWVAVISGRSLDDLRPRVGLPGLIYAGCHGLEISGPRMAFRHGGAVARVESLQSVVEHLQRYAANLPGVTIEPKVLSAAVHYRRAHPEVLVKLVGVLRAVLAGQAGLTVLPGREVFEILPAVAWDKGGCVLWIEARVREMAGPRLTAVYLGDGATDEFAFRALDGRGVTIKVGRGARTLAHHRVLEVDEDHRILSALARVVAGGDTA